jgi:hypothetical protein
MVASFSRGERREGKKVKPTISLIQFPLCMRMLLLNFSPNFESDY